jgi:hypothetical protein
MPDWLARQLLIGAVTPPAEVRLHTGPPVSDPYEQGYRAGESSLKADIWIQFTDAADTMAGLLEFFRTVTGDPELQWPGEAAGDG